MVLNDAVGVKVVVDRRDEVSSNGQVVVHPIPMLLGVPATCRLDVAQGVARGYIAQWASSK